MDIRQGQFYLDPHYAHYQHQIKQEWKNYQYQKAVEEKRAFAVPNTAKVKHEDQGPSQYRDTMGNSTATIDQSMKQQSGPKKGVTVTNSYVR